MPDQPPVAIGVVSWNTRPLLELLVRSIERYTTEPYRIYVFDNGSADGSQEFVRTRSGCTLLDAPQNLGHGGGLNAIAAMMEEELLVCLDSDTHVYRSGWLTGLSRYLGAEVKAVGYQSGYGGDPALVARCLHAFCLMVDLRPFRESGRLPDFRPLIVGGRQLVDTAGQVSLELQAMGYQTRSLMSDEESKRVSRALRRYPNLPGREYHDGEGHFFIYHFFYGSQPYLRRRGISALYRLLRQAYAHVEPGHPAGLELASYTVRCLLTPRLGPTLLRSLMPARGRTKESRPDSL